MKLDNIKLEWAVLGGAALIAASILFVERYQISSISYSDGDYGGTEAVFRLNRWTGEIRRCAVGYGGPGGAVIRDYDRKVIAYCRLRPKPPAAKPS